MTNLKQTKPLLFAEIKKVNTQKALLEINEVLMPKQQEWFSKAYSDYLALIADSKLQMNLFESQEPFDTEVLSKLIIFADSIEIQGNRYIDFLLNLALYKRVFEQNLIPETELIGYSEEIEAYYLKAENIEFSRKMKSFLAEAKQLKIKGFY
ncbi:hypothetical protein [Companilactobacillus crustorum]|uniref:hypothetical protein n=1 Tax=Companilactobacillus crustorum TaxID=392416 RepID=UPI0009579987|nr:hypothetical protein [Companilactobacillus crustorum]APU71359.1 hypothetical protein BI355_1040 [Companilactobacillus crustorum]